MTTTDTEVKYQCTHCYHYLLATAFSADSGNGHRGFLACWCKKCVAEKAKDTRIQKRIDEQERKAKIAKDLALSHPIIDSFYYLNGYLLEAEDLGDIGIKVTISNPAQNDELSSVILNPEIACKLSRWIDQSNEGKLPKERQAMK